jgi:hypothetical protein
MDVMSHRKTWHFSVKADAEQCLQAFQQAMSRPGFKMLAAKWELERGAVSVEKTSKSSPWPAYIATYKGRGGAIGVVTNVMGGRVGERTRDEVQQAIGYTQITFAINPASSKGKTECSMWLSKFSTNFGFTTDARFFRSSMNDVEKQLRILDPSLTVNKS